MLLDLTEHTVTAWLTAGFTGPSTEFAPAYTFGCDPGVFIGTSD